MRLILLFALACSLAAQSRRMVVTVDRRDGAEWKSVDPGLVFSQNDRVRFRFQSNFDGYLYVLNRSTSGKYEQLFPSEETGRDNRVGAGREYVVPANDTLFRIAGPGGHEIVYWLITPVELRGEQAFQPLPPPPSPNRQPPARLIPRCDDTLLVARGECIDSSAGLRPGVDRSRLPDNLSALNGMSARDLLFLRREQSTVVSSPVPLTGPVIYEFHLAHK